MIGDGTRYQNNYEKSLCSFFIYAGQSGEGANACAPRPTPLNFTFPFLKTIDN